MNLIWNPGFRRFEVEFHDFASEQPLAKAVGFKTDGPPAWVWYSYKSEPLTKLRENRPAILNINADARTEYLSLKVVEDRNVATKAALAGHKKELKKKLKEAKQDALRPSEYMTEHGFVALRVACKEFASAHPYIRPAPPQITCFICESPVYSYEYDQTPSCMWCQKEVLDKTDVI
jgi:hypothetical protein